MLKGYKMAAENARVFSALLSENQIKMNSLCASIKLLAVRVPLLTAVAKYGKPPQQYKKVKYNRPIFYEKPKLSGGNAYRRVVHFEKEYTVKPLDVTNLAGRDPITGRVAAKGIGGGIKQKYHQIAWMRSATEEGPPLEEKVIEILKCGCRTADIALIASGDQMKYILATENMKPGDILKSSRYIPRIPVRPSEGDSYPLGALPIGTIIHNMQVSTNSEYTIIHAAGSCATIKKHVAGKVVVQLSNKVEWALNPQCTATVGRLSNVAHDSTPIGSAQRNRELGNRPRSGLWKRKTGYHGRKIRALPPLKFLDETLPPKPEYLRLTHPTLRI